MIKNNVFGEMTYNIGWKSKTEISMFGGKFVVVVKAKAYRESDGITPAQEKAFEDFDGSKTARLNKAEELLNKCANNGAAKRFCPKTLLFLRDGEYALLLDDNEEPENGMAVVLSPTPKLLTQDEYL